MCGIPDCFPEYYRSMWENEAHEAELEMQRLDYYKRNKEYKKQKQKEGCAIISFYPDECIRCECGEEAGPEWEEDDIPVMICSNWESCEVFKQDMMRQFPDTPWDEIRGWFKKGEE